MPAVQPLPEGRAFMVGKQLFKVANCVACHKLNNEGRIFGPDLAKLGSVDKKKHTPQYILESILNPSKDIDKKFQSQVFALDSGKVVTGMVVKETPDTVEIVIDPLAKGRPTVIKKSSIDDRAASKTSIMPLGLLNKLSREEILDLIAYVYARGDKSNPLCMHEHAEKTGAALSRSQTAHAVDQELRDLKLHPVPCPLEFHSHRLLPLGHQDFDPPHLQSGRQQHISFHTGDGNRFLVLQPATGTRLAVATPGSVSYTHLTLPTKA